MSIEFATLIMHISCKVEWTKSLLTQSLIEHLEAIFLMTPFVSSNSSFILSYRLKPVSSFDMGLVCLGMHLNPSCPKIPTACVFLLQQ